MNVLVESSHSIETFDLERISAVAQHVLRLEGAPDRCEVSITLVDDDEMAQLNLQYRGKEGPTDVLSFECDDPWCEQAGDELIAIGDIIIAPDIARTQGEEFGTGFLGEMDLLVVHGVLHLLGYDHIDDDEASKMEAREKELLLSWAESCR